MTIEPMRARIVLPGISGLTRPSFLFAPTLNSTESIVSVGAPSARTQSGR
jgi:hypothetical protein